ncbi:D-serine ammonia-lyase [Eremococcus coleocola]|uniref:D-serine ammonia-lyase n=1 Tax=Eremococcus coleocola TaxID=88132 RepID=UPI00041ADDEA|nr:D-serine ammonia-lyase [Eremococcus coleocola]
MTEKIAGKTLEEWVKESPIIDTLVNGEVVFWINDKKKGFEEAKDTVQFNRADVIDAEERLQRFAPFIKQEFADTEALDGLIESPITHLEAFQKELEDRYQVNIAGQLYLKRDDLLPIAGTIKARGAIYEVLCHAETLALESGLLESTEVNYRVFSEPKFREYFSQFKVIVGTTGNLGISTGVMAAKFGFDAIIHMSNDAKQWKKDYLRSHGVTVIEHNTNFTEAVNQGRIAAEADPQSYFVDDENSKYLFLGYTTAASRLKKQLDQEGIKVDADHPLFVYLPCGVGGSPGGITFGLKHTFGDNVHCFFAEPSHVPSLLLGLITGEYANVSVFDFGIDGKTVMDGLAVPRTSQLVAPLMENFFDGGYTVLEDEASQTLTRLVDVEKIALEPAAVAGLSGPAKLFKTQAGQAYLSAKGLMDKQDQITHIAWATGGSMVPDEDKKAFYEAGLVK